MSYIFISYSHKDSDYAHKLADSLQERGLNAWLDDRIDYGTRWPHVIQEYVDACSAFIVVMTPNSYESEWVQNELVRAKRKRKPIFPLLLEGSEPWLSVEATQYCDVRAGKLPPADFYARLATVVPVQTLVSEIASEGVYLDETTGEIWAEAIEIFFSYTHEDEGLRDELEKHLSILKRQGVIRGWHDRRIGAGREWRGEIDAHLNTAQVILLLVSADFLASDYCWDVEVKRAMERHEAGEARVIPVILRPVDWMSAPFGKLQALPTDAKPVTSWENRDEAFFDVAQGIRAAVVELRLIEMHDTRRGAYTLTEGIQREVSQRADYAGLDLNARQVKAMQYLEKHGKITSAIYCEEIAPRISRRMAHNDLEDLVKRGLVIRVGQTRRTRYVLPGSE